MIIDHTHPEYLDALRKIGKNRWNGAYFYSEEIVKYIIPNVKTDRNWITVDLKDAKIGFDHAIVFVHNHPKCPEWYEWYADYDDLIFVCSSHEDMEKIKHLGTPLYLPLSVDVEYVERFRTKKTMDTAYAGRPEKKTGWRPPSGAKSICFLPRDRFLAEMAKYRRVYAVDRVEIEARILGCEVLKYDCPSYAPYRIIDSLEAAKMLQEKLDEIDGITR